MQINSTITLDIDDAFALLAAEEALRPHLPDEGVPAAAALFDLFGRLHRAVIAAEARPLRSPEMPAETRPVEVVSRRTRLAEDGETAVFAGALQHLDDLDAPGASTLAQMCEHLPHEILQMPVTREELWLGHGLLAQAPVPGGEACREPLHAAIYAHRPYLSRLRPVPRLVAVWRAIAARLPGELAARWTAEADVMEARGAALPAPRT